MKPLVLYLPRRGTLPAPLPVTRDDVPVLLLHGYLGSPATSAPPHAHCNNAAPLPSGSNSGTAAQTGSTTH